MTVRYGIRWASFHAITAENAARIIDVIYARAALACRDAVRVHILRSLDIDAIGGASGRAEKTANALLQAIFVAVQNVNPTVARLKVYRFVGIIFRDRLTKHSAEGHTKTFHECAKRLADFSDDRCHGVRV